MVTVKPKTTVRMQLHGEATSHSRTDVSVRDVETTIDEPIERGGTNMGPSPTEAMIASLIACSNVISQKIAHRAGIDLQRMTIDAEAMFDRRGVTLEEEIEVPFPKITLTFNVTTTADDAAIARLRAELPKFCPISKVIRAAGTTIQEEWIVNRP